MNNKRRQSISNKGLETEADEALFTLVVHYIQWGFVFTENCNKFRNSMAHVQASMLSKCAGPNLCIWGLFLGKISHKKCYIRVLRHKKLFVGGVFFLGKCLEWEKQISLFRLANS